MHDPSVIYGLKVKNKTIRVLLDSGSSGDLFFMKKRSSKHIYCENEKDITNVQRMQITKSFR